MRQTLFAFAALTAFIGMTAGGSAAKAFPAPYATTVRSLVQPVQYYGDPRAEAWRREQVQQEWRRREEERRREAEHWRHHDGDRW